MQIDYEKILFQPDGTVKPSSLQANNLTRPRPGGAS